MKTRSRASMNYGQVQSKALASRHYNRSYARPFVRAFAESHFGSGGCQRCCPGAPHGNTVSMVAVSGESRGPPVLAPTSSRRCMGYGLEKQRNHIRNAMQHLAGSEQAEPAQNTTNQNHQNRTEPCLKHDSRCGDRDGGSLPSGIG
jgi:hypothetical protein